MGKKYQTLLIAVLLNFNTLGVFGEESEEEYQPKFEYIQVFKSIPAIFEYLLDALEERPEILEKNDVTAFKRNIDVEDDECRSSDESKTKKRDIGCDNNKQDELEETNDIGKRDAENKGEVTKTTRAYEYGNSNVVMKVHDTPNIKRFASKLLSTDHQSLKDEAKRGIINSKKFINRRKRNVFKLSDDDIFLEHGNAFFGFEHFFRLDLNPEEIEERILTAEKLLEDYNSNKDKDK